MSKLKLTQRNAWPYGFVLANTERTLHICIDLAEISSRDTLATANARPANLALAAYLKLFTAAPEMYELLANLAAVCDSWDDDYENDEQRANAFWHMARIAKVLLLAKIEGGGK